MILFFENLQEQIDSGKLTIEEAEIINEIAYNKYINEASKLTKVYSQKKERIS